MSGIKQSMNKVYIVDPEDEEVLYIREDALSEAKESNPFIFKQMNEIRQSRRSQKFPGYAKFGNIIKFKELDNDCLLLSEGIITEDLSKPTMQKAKLRVQEDRGRLFGHSDKQNVQIAKDIMKKTSEKEYKDLNPEIMEAYAILPVVLPKDTGVCPYHAATVILKGGDTNITWEAVSGISGIRKPVFDIYSTSIPDKSFYTRYKDMYSVNGKAPAATILYSRDKPLRPLSRTKNSPITKKSSSKSHSRSRSHSSSPKTKTHKNKRLQVFRDIAPSSSPEERLAGRYNLRTRKRHKIKR